MDEKIIIKSGESMYYDPEKMSAETKKALTNLKEKLSEEEMCLSIFHAINGVSRDVYNTIKNDYRIAYKESTEAKNEISRIVSSRYQAEGGNLMWRYSALDDSLVVYVE